ncbi:unnamed protein product [Effrenium voratum]|uniref:Fungal lipase-type domain-containing protein n=1 Tax=Effrenium voratum TaxID=2562239 RepID=A0AA36JC41_9DINO|nr:unnamed protein product [Effrenium voratum]
MATGDLAWGEQALGADPCGKIVIFVEYYRSLRNTYLTFLLMFSSAMAIWVAHLKAAKREANLNRPVGGFRAEDLVAHDESRWVGRVMEAFYRVEVEICKRCEHCRISRRHSSAMRRDFCGKCLGPEPKRSVKGSRAAMRFLGRVWTGWKGAITVSKDGLRSRDLLRERSGEVLFDMAVQLLQAEKVKRGESIADFWKEVAELIWKKGLDAASKVLQGMDLGARVDLRPTQRMSASYDADAAKELWLYATATTCSLEDLHKWPNGFDNPTCKTFAAGAGKVSVFVDNTRPSIQALKWIGLVLRISDAAWFQSVIAGLERWTVGNHKGFVATDDATKRIIVSVAGTGLPTDAGFIADVLADVNANNLYGLGCPVIQVQKTKFGLPYIVKLPGLHHRGFCWFYNMMVLYTSYQADLVKALSANPDYDVVFTGHSLGGASITLAATDYVYRIRPALKKSPDSDSQSVEPCLACDLPEVDPLPGLAVTGQAMLYTYGSPRPTSPAGADYLHGQLNASYRVTRNGDPVPLLMMCQRQDSGVQACRPTERNAYHVAQEVYYPFENGTYFMCNGLGEDPECQDTRSVEKDYTFEQFTYGFGNIHTAYFGTSFDNLSVRQVTGYFAVNFGACDPLRHGALEGNILYSNSAIGPPGCRSLGTCILQVGSEGLPGFEALELPGNSAAWRELCKHFPGQKVSLSAGIWRQAQCCVT